MLPRNEAGRLAAGEQPSGQRSLATVWQDIQPGGLRSTAQIARSERYHHASMAIRLRSGVVDQAGRPQDLGGSAPAPPRIKADRSTALPEVPRPARSICGNTEMPIVRATLSCRDRWRIRDAAIVIVSSRFTH